MFSRIADSMHHPFCTSASKSSWYEDAIEFTLLFGDAQYISSVATFERSWLDSMDVYSTAMICSSMFECFHDAQITITNLIVLTNECNRNLFFRRDNIFYSFLSVTQIKVINI